MKKNLFFRCNLFSIFGDQNPGSSLDPDPDWTRIGIQPEMLDPKKMRIILSENNHIKKPYFMMEKILRFKNKSVIVMLPLL